jgi:hypothetical protein
LPLHAPSTNVPTLMERIASWRPGLCGCYRRRWIACRRALFERNELACLLHKFDRARISRILVDRDRSWRDAVLLFQCLSKETPSGDCIAFGAEQKIDRSPAAVDGALEVCPLALHFDVGLIHPPRAIRHLQNAGATASRSQAHSAESSVTRSCDPRKRLDRPASAQGLDS